MRRLVIVLALIAPQLAEAHSSCHEVSRVVGYAHCRRFGWWSHGATIWWDVGVAALRFDPSRVDATTTVVHDGVPTTYHLVDAPGDRAITAVGGRLRSMAAIGGTFYFGTETVIAPVTGGPRLVAEIASRGMTTAAASTTSGSVYQDLFVVGAHATLAIGAAKLTFGSELAPGFRIATYSTQQLPDAVSTHIAADFVFEAHQRIDAWLTPNITLGAQAAVDLIHRDAISVGLTLGLHLLPFDRTR